MNFEVKIIADSVSEKTGKRLTTFQLKYPRFIHSELMTHRMFSKNASSSRAIPVKTFIKNLREDPATFVEWGKNQSGMQAKELLDDESKMRCNALWLKGRDYAIEIAEAMMAEGAHKQIVNRVLEPWCHMNTILSGTEYDNLWDLRVHPDAQPEFQHLASMMRDLYLHFHKDPTVLKRAEWHLPYVHEAEKERSISSKIKVSVARSCRVSYNNHDQTEPNYEKDCALHDQLLASIPKHASPAEHQAVCMGNTERYGNFIGFKQYRQFIEEGIVL